jgi:hypothetical protein
MTSGSLLNNLQTLLARINDVAVALPVSEFLLSNRAHCSALLGRRLTDQEDEQLLLRECSIEPAVSVYIDQDVLDRLTRGDPLRRLCDDNLADFCTAMEGVSHFQYLVWSIGLGRQLSLLELELQADVDKYAVAAVLLRDQGRGDLPRGLHRRLFNDVSFIAGQSDATRQRYEEANRHAARFCQRIERHYFAPRRFRPEAWLRALREFYRRPHHHKMRFALQ